MQPRSAPISILILTTLGCASSSPSTDASATEGASTNTANASNSSNMGSTATNDANSMTAVTGSALATTGATSSTATGAGGASTDTSTTDPAAATTGGSGGTASTGDGGSGVGGTGAVADPGCGSHKWACWPMPNMVGSGLPNEASYTDNGDGTVSDDITLLTWQLEQPEQTFEWQAALDYCDQLSLGSFDDWRLPTRIEITSVLDHSDGHTGWAREAFPGASGGFHFSASDWILTITQTGAGSGRDFVWAFNLSDGIVSNAYSKTNQTPVRCVRGGGSGEGPSEPASAPPDQYSVVAEGEVRDQYTGLIWQQGDSDDALTWEQALGYCTELELNGNSWRLPSIRELSTLVDEAEVAPAINSELFPDTHYGARSNDWYWATPQRGSAAWGLNFDDGFTGTNTGSAEWNTFGPSWARCVR